MPLACLGLWRAGSSPPKDPSMSSTKVSRACTFNHANHANPAFMVMV
jgi:hypothetical protein